MSGFGETALNVGSGGPNLATSEFTNPTTTNVDIMPWSALAYMASGNPDDGTAVFQVVDATHGLPTSSAADRRGTVTDRSGTITAGGTAQQLAAVNASRKYLFIQNLDAGNDLWIDFTTTAVQSQPSIKLSAGASFVMEGAFVSTELVSVISAVTGHAFAAKEG